MKKNKLVHNYIAIDNQPILVVGRLHKLYIKKGVESAVNAKLPETSNDQQRATLPVVYEKMNLLLT